MKSWEIIADNLSGARRKTDRLADSRAVGLLTYIAATESVLLYAPMKG
jgi:hypothetical protein